MPLVLLIALATVMAVAMVAAGAARAGRAGHAIRVRSRAAPEEVSVTLSVLPTRTAVVVVDTDADEFSAVVNCLVQHAVREAFLFDAVDVVEVRRRTGMVVDRRRRPVGTRAGAPSF